MNEQMLNLMRENLRPEKKKITTTAGLEPARA